MDGYKPSLPKFQQFMEENKFTKPGNQLWVEGQRREAPLNQLLAALPISDIVLNHMPVGSRVKPPKELLRTSIVGDNRAIGVSALMKMIGMELEMVLPFSEDVEAFLKSRHSIDELKSLFKENKAFQLYILKMWEGVLLSDPSLVAQWYEVTPTDKKTPELEQTVRNIRDCYTKATAYLKEIMGCSDLRTYKHPNQEHMTGAILDQSALNHQKVNCAIKILRDNKGIVDTEVLANVQPFVGGLILG